ncbi:type II secretion system protein GspL [Alkalimonas sp. MEB108]|uniref:Type II secretion system protein L n=1 Tax=Alkalimonas cellulosilytica TaxID=3058395 RepID=A0ABU7J8A8_9GAMM|nr:type II secretion system protein GspL [Alkalimonas sp. MEB108]MEE2002242.1 type II secretion system protein GspL [Alkalimonas sp. MEB108]
MSEQLLIRLGSRADQVVSWLVWSTAAQEIIASGDLPSASALEQLGERLGPRPVLVLVPAADVVLKEVALPAKPSRQILQALPYMLEEDVTEDIEQLWLALGSVRKEQDQYLQQLALCKKAQLEQWLSWLTEAGFQPRQLVPDALLLPTESLPAAIEFNGSWLLRQGDWQATSVEHEWWPDYLELAALPELTSYSPWPGYIEQVHQLAEPELPLALLARQAQQPAINLLQGDYAPKRAVNKSWQLWQPAAVLAGVCLTLYLTLTAVEGWRYGQQARALQQQAVQTYQAAFPGESVVNLRALVQRKLQQAGLSQHEQHFLALLLDLQNNLASVNDMQLDNLRFDARRTELRFQAKADGFQSFERLKNQLEQAGYQVDQGALSNDGSKVQGTVSMRKAA